MGSSISRREAMYGIDAKAPAYSGSTARMLYRKGSLLNPLTSADRRKALLIHRRKTALLTSPKKGLPDRRKTIGVTLAKGNPGMPDRKTSSTNSTMKNISFK